MRMLLENLSDEISCSDYVLHVKYFAEIVTHFCPHCGTESFGAAMFPTTDVKPTIQPNKELLQQVSQDFQKFTIDMAKIRKINRCPACGSAFVEGAGYSDCTRIKANRNELWVSDSELNPIFKKMKEARAEQAKEEAAKEVDALKNRLAVANSVSDSFTGEGLEIASNPKMLLPYIGHLMKLETGIYSLEQHLTELYESKLQMSSVFFGSKEECYRAIRNAEDELNEANYDLNVQIDQLPKPKVEYAPKPQEPVFEMQKPQEPSYITPGLFNKKKVLAENEAKKATFEQETAQYNQAYERFQVALGQYEIALANWTHDCTVKEEAVVAKQIQQESGPYLKKIQAACCEIDELGKTWALVEQNNLTQQVLDLTFQETLDAAFARTSVLYTNLYASKWNPDENVGMALVTKEITNSEKLLGDLIAAKNRMYGLNVIHPKYRNLVAISAFYDYLMTGRCSMLTGNGGAYNLFEAESKTKLIMDRISDITASLEELRENQNFLYQQVAEANNGIQILNQSMGKVVTHLAKMNAKADRMSRQLAALDDKTSNLESTVATVAENAEIAAHYSQISAFYAKRNAELTDALGYLIAFN